MSACMHVWTHECRYVCMHICIPLLEYQCFWCCLFGVGGWRGLGKGLGLHLLLFEDGKRLGFMGFGKDSLVGLRAQCLIS